MRTLSGDYTLCNPKPIDRPSDSVLPNGRRDEPVFLLIHPSVYIVYEHSPAMTTRVNGQSTDLPCNISNYDTIMRTTTCCAPYFGGIRFLEGVFH